MKTMMKSLATVMFLGLFTTAFFTVATLSPIVGVAVAQEQTLPEVTTPNTATPEAAPQQEEQQTQAPAEEQHAAYPEAHQPFVFASPTPPPYSFEQNNGIVSFILRSGGRNFTCKPVEKAVE